MNAASGTHTGAEAVESPDRLRSQEDATARRLTPTERLHEVTMAFAQRAASPPEHSVTISRNARGVFQFEVTVRGDDIRHVFDEAELIANTLAASYPYPDPPSDDENAVAEARKVAAIQANRAKAARP